MPHKNRRPCLTLTTEEQGKLLTLSRSQTESAGKVRRAKILLYYARGETISNMSRWLDISRPTVDRCIARALEVGPLEALKDLPRSGRPRQITPEARAWLVSLACQKPKDLGYSYELWTLKLLAQHARENGPREGHPSLGKIRRGTVWKILAENQIKPHRIRYYMEKRDEAFDEKMKQVLEVYREVDKARQYKENEASGASDDRSQTVYISYDEKPGIQAIENTAPDLLPVPGQYPSLLRDGEYKRHGTVSFLGGLDLLTGRVLGLVEDRHRSREFIGLLKHIDALYPKSATIHLILDNHSAHTSKETRDYLETRPDRFRFTFTPTHGSWLNIIESFFAKMAKTVLRGIRVCGKDELKQRILLYLEELNRTPTPFRWSYGLGSAS